MKIRLARFIFTLSLFVVATAQAGTLFSSEAKSSLYKEECSGCHIAYSAWLLPARSWDRIMSSLSDHFGDNASLDHESKNTIGQYLQENSADKSGSYRAKKITRSVKPDSTPTRITELRYFKHEHDEIPYRLIKANPRVKSLSNCEACHQGAEQGSFDEHQTRIPGYGQWDD